MCSSCSLWNVVKRQTETSWFITNRVVWGETCFLRLMKGQGLQGKGGGVTGVRGLVVFLSRNFGSNFAFSFFFVSLLLSFFLSFFLLSFFLSSSSSSSCLSLSPPLSLSLALYLALFSVSLCVSVCLCLSVPVSVCLSVSLCLSLLSKGMRFSLSILCRPNMLHLCGIFVCFYVVVFRRGQLPVPFKKGSDFFNAQSTMTVISGRNAIYTLKIVHSQLRVKPGEGWWSFRDRSKWKLGNYLIP